MSLEFALKWQSEIAQYNDRLFCEHIDLRRDELPADLATAVAELTPGESVEQEFAPGQLVAAHAASNIIEFPDALFQRQLGPRQIEPRRGRFYPQVLAAAALASEPVNYSPFRLLEVSEDRLVADKNHPLASYALRLAVKCWQVLASPADSNPGRQDITHQVTASGSGLQCPYRAQPTDFYPAYSFPRDNEVDDAEFYRQPRLVQHLDDTAIQQVSEFYARILRPGMKVLDLMSSHLSHLPAVEPLEVVGLGMNQQELAQNPRLSTRTIHDLNKQTRLPYADHSFDAVICTSSIEYLVDPLAVVAEVARVLKPGAIFMVTFSDRWFPGKEINLWPELHPFERQGLVLDFFVRSERFDDLHTESIRGLPRPPDDIHRNQRRVADPVFAVWGAVAES